MMEGGVWVKEGYNGRRGMRDGGIWGKEGMMEGGV